MADYGRVISLSQARDMSHTSDDEDEEQSPRSLQPLSAVGSSRGKAYGSRSGGGGEMVTSMGEIIRKPRGRPPGSKNKPKPPIVITRDSDTAMKPVVLEISAGSDVVEQVVEFARRRHVGLSIMSGSGTISNVTLRHPMAHAPTISLHGPLHIVSLSGTYVGPSGSSSSSASSSPAANPSASSPPSCSAFSISLAGSQGQVFGGIIAGKVVAQAPVIVVAATFVSPPFHRLPAVAAALTGSGGGEGEEGGDHKHQNHHHHHQPHHHRHEEGASKVMEQSRTGSSMSTMSVYSTSVAAIASTPTPLNCQIPPDVLHWASSASRPHHF
ncbi:AT-hook motif nuclear-localized protein 17-like [Malania oleifera]|uniref:AT-hook motif nuclear-localized protein 17-like n=1 Tax=Malania oleifera TaxID=397392 RepID=UPI0025AE252A|nr:AT-hook motif nuclear-localized protein 17-like [Malania oleifera]